jgi:transcription elongation factor Elf1
VKKTINVDGIETEVYPITCPVCLNEMHAALSIGHKLGMEFAGAAKCKKCGTLMHLTYSYEKNSMEAEIYSEYAKRLEREGGEINETD